MRRWKNSALINRLWRGPSAQGNAQNRTDSHLSHEVPTRRRKYRKSPKWPDISPHSQERSFPSAGPERFQAPQIQSFVMTKHVSVCIRRQHSKRRRVWRVPPVLYLHDLVHPPTHHKPPWPFIRPVSRITLHLNQHDLVLPHVTVFHVGIFRISLSGLILN
jgi:hypothetical protein